MDESLKHIVEKYFNDNVSPEDMLRLDAWFDSLSDRPSLFSLYSCTAITEMGHKMYTAIMEAIGDPSTGNNGHTGKQAHK